MDVGIQLPVQAQSRVFAQAWEAHAGPAELAAVAGAADRAGFAYVAVCDHTVVPRDRATTMGATWYEPVATLAWLAASTARVRLLTHVLVLPLRHPLQAAKALATVDRLSGGRLVVGVGAGHVAEEFAALGVDFSARGALLDRGIDVLRAALGGAIDGLLLEPAPVQAPPPIWVGGSSRAARRRAAERGDGWLPQGRITREEVAEVRARRPIDVGALTPPLDLDEPDRVLTLIGDLAGIGATSVQVAFRSRSAAHLVEQVERFGEELLPQL